MQNIVKNIHIHEYFQWEGHDLNKPEDDIVRYYRHPNDSGDRICSLCNNKMHDHGWLDSCNTDNDNGYTVCIGDYVVKINNYYYVIKPLIIDNNYTILNQNIFTNNFQDRLIDWFKFTFQEQFPELIDNKRERNHRFIEEAIELVQACDMSKSELISLVNEVYNRPKGDIFKEIGGVCTTLTVLANNHGISINEAAEAELKRNYTIIDKLRKKQPHRSSMISKNHKNEEDLLGR